MQKPTAGTSSTQQPSKKVDSDMNSKKPAQKQNDRSGSSMQDDDLVSPQRSK
jgi:hypothetical protein